MRLRRSPVPLLVALLLAPAVLLSLAARATDGPVRSGTAVLGTVVDTAGRPVAGAEVEILPTFDPILFSGPIHTETATDGSFAVRDLPPDRIRRLSIIRPQSATFIQYGIEIGPAGGTTDLGRIILPDGSTLSGRVQDPAGRPLAGVPIHLETGDSWLIQSARPGAVTKEDGTFTFTGLPPYTGFTLNVCPEDAFGESFGLPEVPPEPVDLVLYPAARVAGRILGPNGVPVAGAWLSAVKEPRSTSTGNDVSHICVLWIPPPCDRKAPNPSDSEGRFAVSGLTPGVYVLLVGASGFTSAEVKGLRVHAGEKIDGLEVRLEPHPVTQDAIETRERPNDPQHEARGRVASPESTPVDGLAAPAGVVESRREEEVTLSGKIRGPSPREMAWVRVSAARPDRLASDGVVAADGTYRILHLGPGKATVIAGIGNKSVRWEVEIPRGQREITLDLGLDLTVPPVSEVRGRVTGPDREPLPGARVRASRQDRTMHGAFARSDGTFTLWLEDGTWSIEAGAGGYKAGSPQSLKVPGKVPGVKAAVEIRMESLTVLHGQLPGLEPDEIPWISATSSSGSRSGEADPDGGYLIAGLEPGTWTVTGSLPVHGAWKGNRTTTAQVTVPPGVGDAFLDLDFAMGSLELTARAPAGGKILAADLFLKDGTPILSTGLLVLPSVRFDRLRPDTYRLRWTLEGHNTTEQEVVLTTDREITLDQEAP